MLHIRPTRDFDYIESVLQRPGMKKLCSCNLKLSEDIGKMVREPTHRFFEVEKDGEMLGFTSLTFASLDEALIHLALRTRGEDTLECVNNTVLFGKFLGLKRIHAVYPIARKSLERIADSIGFSNEGIKSISGMEVTHRILTI